MLTWLAPTPKARRAHASSRTRARRSRTLGDEWLDGVEAGVIGRRRGKGKPYSRDDDRELPALVASRAAARVRPDGRRGDQRGRVADVGRPAQPRGLSRSRIANHVAVASSIYAWALSPSRRFVTRNPLRLVELPPNDEKPRLRVALAPEEAEQLLAALEPEDRVPYALAFYAGLRRVGDPPARMAGSARGRRRIASHVLVARSKSEAGTQRRPPIAEPLRRSFAKRGCARAGRPRGRCRALGDVGQARRSARPRRGTRPGLNRITLHECRHTYASMLMAAGYTIKELMEYMGHGDLQMVNRYVKLLPQPRDDDAADRLNDYLRRSRTS